MKVGIIGSGASGLAAAKNCLDYGFEPVCFEKTHEIGGLWRYKPGECDGEASVNKSTVINTGKEMTAFSDFPPPKDFANFMHNTKVIQYFNMYIDKYNLRKYIRFNTTVKLIQRADDYDKTGKWKITYEHDGNDVREIFDGVMLCTGHHAEKNMPKLSGIENFTGEVLHSQDYKDHRGYEDKRVVVVGIGNSGGDITVELSRIASQVYLVTRRGAWVFNRVSDKGLPMDCNTTRYTNAVIGLAPNLMCKAMQNKLNNRFDHANYGLKPRHTVFQAHPTVNDDLPNRILCGTVVVKPNISGFRGSTVIFEDGSEAENMDVIVMATGYSFGFPYLEEGIIPVEENKASLYKYMYPPKLPFPSLAVIGFVQPLGSVIPVSELQGRVFLEGLAGAMKLPPRIMMEMDVKTKTREMAERYVASPRHTIQVDYIPYMDEIAERQFMLKFIFGLTIRPNAPMYANFCTL